MEDKVPLFHGQAVRSVRIPTTSASSLTALHSSFKSLNAIRLNASKDVFYLFSMALTSIVGFLKYKPFPRVANWLFQRDQRLLHR